MRRGKAIGITDDILPSTSKCRNIQTAVCIDDVDTGFSFENIELIQISNIQIISLVIEMKTIVHTSFLKTHFGHEIQSFVFSNATTADIWLFHHNYESVILIFPETQNFEICRRE